MFKLGKPAKTKDGQTLVPYTIQEDAVYCFDSDGQTVVKKIYDFDYSKEEEKELKEVIPKEAVVEVEEKIDEKKNSDIIFGEEDVDDGFREKDEKEDEPKEPYEDDEVEEEKKEEEEDDKEEDSSSDDPWDEVDDLYG